MLPWASGRCQTPSWRHQTKETIAMQPRGQLWFALEGICRDFRNFSGLPEKESQEVLIVVLTNMLAEQKTALEKLSVEAPLEPKADGESAK
jgi:hypothetical protein